MSAARPTAAPHLSVAFSTDDYRPAERFDAFHEEFARRVMQLDVWRDHTEEPFRGEVALRGMGSFFCARIAMSPIRYERSTARLSDGDDCVVVGMHAMGRSLLEQQGLTSDSLIDFASLTTNAHEGGGIFSGEGLALRIPRDLLARYLPTEQTFSPSVIRRNSHLAYLLSGYVNAYLALPPDKLDQELSDTVGRHVVDLIALAMGARGESFEAIEAGGLRAARRRAIMAEIARRFSSPDVSPDMIAQTVGVSPRYLRALLEEIGTSFTDLVLEHRLERARELLTDPARPQMRITDIAYDVGFSDLSYFNRAFRRRYNATPSDVRAESMRG